MGIDIDMLLMEFRIELSLIYVLDCGTAFSENIYFRKELDVHSTVS